MKASKFFALGIIFFIVSSFRMPGAEVKGAQLSTADDPNYVVIGAFSIYENAVSFTSKASKLHLDAKYEMNQNRNLYYVYVLSTNDRQQAIEEALRLRKESPYNDTWVYHGNLNASTSANKGTDINPVTAETISNVNTNDAAVQSGVSNTDKGAVVAAAGN